MSTTCTINFPSFRFMVKSKQGERYELEIEYTLAVVDEKVTAYGMLEMRGDKWALLEMTFENAHDEIVLYYFFKDLAGIKATAYPSAVAFFEANRQPDIFEAIDKVVNSFKKAI